MVDTKYIRNDIQHALDKILVNENKEILVRKIRNIIFTCELKIKELSMAK